MKNILSDDIVKNRSGFEVFTYQQKCKGNIDGRKLSERSFDTCFPRECIISPLYLDYHSYKSLLKPDDYRSFFIMRDPRDIVISWYYSVKDTHPPVGKIPQHRKLLKKMNFEDGIKYCIEYLGEFGLFSALRSWIARDENDPRLKIFRFEDITDPAKQQKCLTELFGHCRINISPGEIKVLMDKYHFKKMRSRLMKGNYSHYRRGHPGEWKLHFNRDILILFSRISGGITGILGYDTR